jgi:hypothetical protein
VLAEALGCNTTTLHEDVIFPLGREAGGGGGTLLLTRHRHIARAALGVMREKYGEDIDGRYVELAQAAMDAKGKGQYVPELHRWDYDLPQHFLENRPDLAMPMHRSIITRKIHASRSTWRGYTGSSAVPPKARSCCKVSPFPLGAIGFSGTNGALVQARRAIGH